MFRKIALGGGGMKGILHIGALQELGNHQSLIFPDGVYGCSIGSIVATYLAFSRPVDKTLVDLSKKYLTIEKIVPQLTFKEVSSLFSSKGLYSMDLFETTMVQFFDEVGIQIRDKKIGDADMPLYIIASNITKGVPTVFSKDVPILEALKCSCCIPGVFKPYCLYNQVYVDGGLFVPSISSIAPDSLNLSLGRNTISRITPESLESMSPQEYMRNLYSMGMNQFHDAYKTDLTVQLKYEGLYSDSILEDFDVDSIVENSRTILRDFLRSKCLCEKCSKPVD